MQAQIGQILEIPANCIVNFRSRSVTAKQVMRETQLREHPCVPLLPYKDDPFIIEVVGFELSDGAKVFKNTNFEIKRLLFSDDRNKICSVDIGHHTWA